jgi:hypothetical protein
MIVACRPAPTRARRQGNQAVSGLGLSPIVAGTMLVGVPVHRAGTRAGRLPSR